MKQITWFCLCWLLLLSVNVGAADETLSPEAKALIGTKIPPKEPGRGGKIPGWEQIETMPIGISLQPNSDLVLSDLFQGNIRMIAIIFIDHKDQSQTILDARVLPANLFAAEIGDGKSATKNDSPRFFLTDRCERGNPGERIIGLWRPKTGAKCNALSTIVKKAWLLNQENGRLTDIPSIGVSCRDPVEGDCD